MADDNGGNFLMERPPSLNYSVDLANPEQKKEITGQLAAMGRQTMNLRTMPESQLILLKDEDNGGRIIGWQGFSGRNERGLPEKFSLHLDPAYRAFLLGLVLETVLYKHLHEAGLGFVLVRMNKTSTSELMAYRMKVGVFREVPADELPPAWLGMCGGCELHKKSCKEQAYFKIDVARGLEIGEKRLGVIAKLSYPYPIVLQADRIRAEKRGYAARFAA